MGATYNNKDRIIKDPNVVEITELSVPKIKIPDTMKVKIIKAFQLSGEYVRGGEVSKTVKNSTAQYAHNSRVTGRVELKLKGRVKPVTVDLFGYWPSWANLQDDKGKTVRHYSKEHGSKVIKLMCSGSFADPTQQLLEHVAYNALSVIKSRQNTPREGLIKAQVLEYLESSGIEVVKAWYRGKEFDRKFLTSKIATMKVIFDAMQSVGQFAEIEKRRDSGVFTIQGQ